MTTRWTDLAFWYEIRRYQPSGSWADNWALWFNLAEAVAWLTIAALVVFCWSRHRHSPLELVYASAFLMFGLTDILEAFVLETWLLWVKGLILLAILGLRSRILKRYYPGWKTY